MYGADFGFIAADLIALAVGAVITCIGAAYLLRTADD
jgi:hypothetical protein